MSDTTSAHRIAVVGIGCRVPGASDAEGLWRIVRGGVDAFTDLDEAQLLAAGVPMATIDDPRYVRRAPLLADIESFDAAFFGLSPEQADLLDPQHRLFFECAWEALEDAGLVPERFRGSVGVYGGCSVSSYLLFNLLPSLQPGASAATMLAMIGNEKDYLPTHLSYLLGLTGPSVGVQSACSTSLAAVHLACQGLLAGECDLALAGGASVRVPHRVGYRHEEGSILSPTGACRSFDAAADGTVFGSGAGVVALRRLEDALRDGDPVHAVILGSAMNNDGNRKAGYTAPSVDGQASVIAEALAVAGVPAQSIGLVEAHGTGTPIGDPIEVKALAEVFRGAAPESIALACAKASFGHLEAAAGITGFIAAAMALREAQLPPIAHFERPNPLLKLESTPLAIGAEARAWMRPGVRRAGVSSFGIGGTNVHVVLEEAPPAAARAEAADAAGGGFVLCASARSEAALPEAVRLLVAALDDGVDLASASRTCMLGRRAFEYRVAVAARTPAQARSALAVAPVVRAGTVSKLVLLCGEPRDAARADAHREVAQRLRDWGLAPEVLSGPGDALQAHALAGAAVLTLDVGPAPAGMASAIVAITLGGDDLDVALMQALAMLHAHGLSADWRRVLGHGPRARLPRTVFQRRRHWREATVAGAGFPGEVVDTPLARRVLATTLRPQSAAWLADHRVDGRVVLPAAAFASLAVEAGLEGVSGLTIERPLEIMAQGTPLQTVRDASGRVEIHARIAGVWRRCAAALPGPPEADLGVLDVEETKRRCAVAVDPAALHARMREGGIALGETLRRFVDMHTGPGEALARLRPADDLAADALRVHPAVIDALFQSLAAIVDGRGLPAHLPVSFDTMRLAPEATTAAAAWCHARLRPPGAGGLVGDLALADADGRVLLRVDGLACRPARGDAAFLRHVYLPEWVRRDGACVTVVPSEPATARQFDLAGHEASLPALDRLCAAWVARAFVGLGARFVAGETLVLATPFSVRYERLLPRLWRMLEEDGLVDASRRVLRTANEDPESLQSELERRHPEMATELGMLARCGRALADVLAGRTEALALLFTGAGGDDAPALYAQSRYATALNEIACDLVAPLAAAGIELNVLEIGGGTGGATAHLLPALSARAAEYRFTDISPAFLAAARARFASHPCLRTDTLDIERDPVAQGIPAASRHLVIAANVLHAATDVAAALQRARRTLVPGGWLLLVEGLRPSRWLDLTFALTDGWWHGTDRERRPDYPLLDEQGWRRVLGECGFDEVHVVSPGAGRLADQGVIVARRAFVEVPGTAIVREGLVAKDAAATVLARLKGEQGSAQRLVVATRGARRVRAWDDPDPGQAEVAGLVRAAALERPQAVMRTVDLDPLGGDDEAALAIEAALDDDETDTAWRDGVRHVLRLHRAQPPAACPEAFRLSLAASAPEGAFALLPIVRTDPPAGFVEIRVVAAGLNFKDILTHAAAIPGGADAAPGGECAGVVAAVGAGVKELAVGERVLALAGGSFASHVVVPASRVARLPETLSFEQGAVLPIAGMTALHALRELAELGAGQRILVHAASGGVGLHAVALARAAGAEVLATAGSPAKRAWLRRLGVRHVFDSRRTDFAAQVMEATGGEGVDVVLNSLSGDAIAAGMCVVRAGGRFIEIGRAGIWSAEEAARRFPQVDYRIVALDRIDDAEGGRLLRAALAAAVAGELATPPVTRFPMARAEEAYRHMRQARHVGRIALTLPLPPVFRDDRSYLVTGGLGGLGLAVARWAIARGARHLVLAGRHSPSPEALPVLEALRAGGARVETEVVDVSDSTAVEWLAASFTGLRPPVAMVFHAAGTLDDAPLAAQDDAHFARVRGPKLDAARHLSRHFRGLEALVLFGSAAGLLGSAGQANHSAASAGLDAYAQGLHARGVAAITVDWGPWADIGAAARRGVGERLAKSGMGEIAPAEGLAILGWVLEQRAGRVAALPIDWPVFAAQPLPALFRDVAPRAPEVAIKAVDRAIGDGAFPGQGETVAATLAALAPARRLPWLEARVAREASRLIGGGATLPPERALTELGLDSLQAIELRNRLGALAGTSLPATLIFDYPSVRALAGHLLALLGAAGDAPAPRASATMAAQVRAPVPAGSVGPAGEPPLDADAFDSLLRELESRHLKP